MATKEDILEQMVEEYLIHQGYFVRHNLKFLPDKSHKGYIQNKDSNHSDIDVLGFHPLKTGHDRVMAVSCKSWQSGFRPQSYIQRLKTGGKVSGKEAWKSFRELTNDKWAAGFIETIQKATGAESFTHVTAVAKLVGSRDTWEQHQPFIDTLKGNAIKILTFEEMVLKVRPALTQTVASSEIGRMLQLFKASGILK